MNQVKDKCAGLVSGQNVWLSSSSPINTQTRHAAAVSLAQPCGPGLHVSLSQGLCVPFRHRGRLRKQPCLPGSATMGMREQGFLWVNTEEKGKATFARIIKFSVFQTEYKLAPPTVTNEGRLGANRRADSQRGLVGRPQPASRIHHPLNQSTIRTSICH